jgi:hypothetical protein
MANKEKIDSLLSDLSELKELLAGMRNMEICPLACFSQTFDLAYKVIRDLHMLEGMQIDAFQKQMQAYQDVIESALQLQEAQADLSQLAMQDVQPEPPAAKPSVSLNEALEKKNLSDFRKAFSLNDRFLFRKELFGGDEAKMNKVIADLNELPSYEASIRYLRDRQDWDSENETVAAFLKLLEKRFL